MSERTSRKVSKRKKRVPIGTFRSKLAVDAKLFPDHQLRWMNDELNRLAYSIDGGYEFVRKDELQGTDVGDRDVHAGNSDLGTKVSQLVGTKEDGSPLTSYLMKIPKEFYKEDQEEKQKLIAENEEAIFRGQHDDAGESETRYVPAEGMSIRRGS